MISGRRGRKGRRRGKEGEGGGREGGRKEGRKGGREGEMEVGAVRSEKQRGRRGRKKRYKTRGRTLPDVSYLMWSRNPHPKYRHFHHMQFNSRAPLTVFTECVLGYSKQVALVNEPLFRRRDRLQWAELTT